MAKKVIREKKKQKIVASAKTKSSVVGKVKGEDTAPKPQKKSAEKKLNDRALTFVKMRTDHSTEAAEDYCLLVHSLIEERGEARTCAIATELGVSHVTALRTIQRLVQQDYLVTHPYSPVELTAKGKKVAKSAKERSELLQRFLVKLGVSEKIASQDAQGIEHHVSKGTITAIKKFVGEK